jgi:hypothetical protein
LDEGVLPYRHRLPSHTNFTAIGKAYGASAIGAVQTLNAWRSRASH